MKILVCEGPCSPATREYDDAIRMNRTAHGASWSAHNDGVQEETKARAAEIARRLVHTRHTEDDGKRYRCVQCGTVREF